MFKVLSIDGGGIKGLYSAAFLAGLENRFGKISADVFDLIAGTSTGGILALGVAARIPAKDIVKFYKEWGPKIFPWWRRHLPPILFPQYRQKPLKNALKSVFQDKTLNDLNTDEKTASVCISSVNASTGSPKVFKTCHCEQLKADKNIKLWQVALASAAAPYYFPIYKLNHNDLEHHELHVDGGLWANNPSMIAYIESIKYFQKKPNEISLLSLGNIAGRINLKSNAMRSKGAIQWGKKSLLLTLDAQAHSIHQQIRLIFRAVQNEEHYIRVDDPPPHCNCGILKMDNATKSNLNDLITLGKKRSEIMGVTERITNLFSEGQ